MPPERAVAVLTRAGLEVYAGFIVGFDSDGPDIFGRQLAFISGLPIARAMVGLLAAFPGTQLWRRLTAGARRLKHRTKTAALARAHGSRAQSRWICPAVLVPVVDADGYEEPLGSLAQRDRARSRAFQGRTAVSPGEVQQFDLRGATVGRARGYECPRQRPPL
jgi:hypothetical protein